jgi:GNAT superfamily N-acetyltransferase
MKTLADFFSFKHLTMRRYSPADAGAVEALVNHAFKYQEPFAGRPRLDPVRLEKRSLNSDIYVVLDGQTIVATIYTQPNGTSMHFGLFAIADSHRGNGLAQAMLNALNQYAKATGAKTIDLDYTAFAPWLGTYYQRHGFTETGQTEELDVGRLVQMSKSVT